MSHILYKRKKMRCVAMEEERKPRVCREVNQPGVES